MPKWAPLLKERKKNMANSTTSCPKKPTIDEKAQQAIDAIAPVLANSDAPATDLRKALDLANTTLKVIRSDPHHL
jgi:hypothetical protein